MGRRAKTYTIVSIHDEKLLASSGHDAEELRDELAALENDAEDVMVFEGASVPFTISRQPTVKIGATRERKPRGRKPAEKTAKRNGGVSVMPTEKSTEKHA